MTRTLAALLAVGLAAGCTESAPPRQAVKGKVTWKGQPLANGRIEFESIAGRGQKEGAVVANGAYELPAKTGLVPDKYRVRIYLVEPVKERPTAPPGEAPEKAEAPPAQAIDEKYNTKSELAAQVTAGGKNEFDFKLD